MCSIRSKHTASITDLRVTWEENSNSQGTLQNLEHQVKTQSWKLWWVWYGCQGMTLKVLLEKLIPKVLQAEDDPITKKNVRYIKDDEKNRTQRFKYQSNWDCQILIVRVKTRNYSEEKRRKCLIENQCSDVPGAKPTLQVSNALETCRFIVSLPHC